MTRDELIAALEQAEGPSRELDFCIWQFLNPEYAPARGWTGADAYTCLIDAALTLVPEGWHAEIGARPDWPWVKLHEFPMPCRSVPLVHAATPAIALCIAALKARGV